MQGWAEVCGASELMARVPELRRPADQSSSRLLHTPQVDLSQVLKTYGAEFAMSPFAALAQAAALATPPLAQKAVAAAPSPLVSPLDLTSPATSTASVVHGGASPRQRTPNSGQAAAH